MMYIILPVDIAHVHVCNPIPIPPHLNFLLRHLQLLVEESKVAVEKPEGGQRWAVLEEVRCTIIP